jgi:uncharacterized protein YceH (UPF0502 family)
MEMVLTDVEVRVLGCLIEKSMATPEHYPLSLNSLTAACNQKSNRAPVMALAEHEVEDALDGLRYTHHLVCQVTTTGSRVPKYKHDAGDKLPLTELDVALMCELMVRGPQTAGELRTHARRLREIESVAVVVDSMSALARLEPDPMVVQLPPGPGHREPRYAHLLSGEVEIDAMAPSAPAPRSTPKQDDRVVALEAKVDALQDELQQLRDEFATFRKQFE